MKAAVKEKVRFTDLVLEACETEKQWRELNTVAASKLSAAAFLREALEVAHSTEEKLSVLAEAIKGPGFDHSQAFIRQATKWIRE